MFVHISPELDVVGETISTLKFAERVSTVELGAARVNNDCTEVKELKEQIACLKAALAGKDGELGHFQHFTMGSPERQRFKSAGSSPSHRGSSPPQLRSHSSGDLLAINLEGDWIDNMKQVGVDSEENLSGHWEEQFDDLDFVTSDYSGADSLWLFNPPKVASNIPNGLVSSKLKKPGPKQAKTSEIRSLIPAPPTRRLSTGNISPLQKAARHPIPALDGKKRIGGGK